MAKPAARKKSPPPAVKPGGRTQRIRTCTACGVPAGMTHLNKCSKFSCDECGMMAGSHGVECSKNPAIEDSARTKTEVDGEEAVIDGRTGGVKERPLLESADSDYGVLAHLARCVEKEAWLRTAANRAKNALSKAHKETKAAQQHAAEHYARSRQLVMDLTTGGTDPEEDE